MITRTTTDILHEIGYQGHCAEAALRAVAQRSERSQELLEAVEALAAHMTAVGILHDALTALRRRGAMQDMLAEARGRCDRMISYAADGVAAEDERAYWEGVEVGVHKIREFFGIA